MSRAGAAMRRMPDASGGAISHEMAKTWGTVVVDRRPSGSVRYRVDLGVVAVSGVKARRRIDHGPGPHFVPFTDRRDAEVELDRIRARAIGGEPKASIVASYLRSEVEAQLFETWLSRYVEHFERLAESGDRSWTSFRDVRRWAAPGGYWRWWDGRDIRGLTNADGTAWTVWLSEQPSQSNKAAPGALLSPKTRKNVIDGLRAMLTWASEESATGAGRAWEVPILRSPRYDRRATPTIAPETTAAILADIAWEDRGAYLAACWETVRFGSLAAATLEDYDPERRMIHWHRGRQGSRVGSPVRGQKNHADRWREVWAPELVEWLEWRLAQVTPEDRLEQRRTALFWHSRARNRAKAWSYDAFHRTWREAAKRHGVTLSPQAGTRTSSISAMAEVVPLAALQQHTMHASAASLTRHYTVGAKPERAAIVRRMRGVPSASPVPGEES